MTSSTNAIAKMMVMTENKTVLAAAAARNSVGRRRVGGQQSVEETINRVVVSVGWGGVKRRYSNKALRVWGRTWKGPLRR